MSALHYWQWLCDGENPIMGVMKSLRGARFAIRIAIDNQYSWSVLFLNIRQALA